MSTTDSTKYDIAIRVAPRFTKIMGVPDLQNQVREIYLDQQQMLINPTRKISLGDAIGMASLLVSLVALFLQIEQGHTYQGASQEEIKERVNLRLKEETDLPAETREEMINKMIESFANDDESNVDR